MDHSILLVEDEEVVAQVVQRGLQQAGYAVHAVTTGEEALALLATRQYELVVLDLLLPGVSGLEVVQELRRRRQEVPVLALTACGGLENRIQGLNAGCDDYVTKPFAFGELLARVRALQRRTTSGGLSQLAYGDLTLDVGSRTATRGTRRIRLTEREYQLLESLMRTPETVVSRTALLTRLWGGGPALSNKLEVYVNLLRKKIDGGAERKLLHTVRGIGYVLRDDG